MVISLYEFCYAEKTSPEQADISGPILNNK